MEELARQPSIAIASTSKTEACKTYSKIQANITTTKPPPGSPFAPTTFHPAHNLKFVRFSLSATDLMADPYPRTLSDKKLKTYYLMYEVIDTSSGDREVHNRGRSISSASITLSAPSLTGQILVILKPADSNKLCHCVLVRSMPVNCVIIAISIPATKKGALVSGTTMSTIKILE